MFSPTSLGYRFSYVTLIFTVIASLMAPRVLIADQNQKISPRNPVQSRNSALSDQVKPGIIVLKFRQNIKIQSGAAFTDFPGINEKIAEFSVTEIRQPYAYLEKSSLEGAEELLKIHYFYFSENEDVRKVADRFAGDPMVEYAEPLYIHYPDIVPNDPAWSQNADLIQVEAPLAWDIVIGDTGDVVVAVVDNGTIWNHEDLVENLWQNMGEDADGDGHTIEFISGSWEFDPGDLNGLDDDGNGKIDDVVGWDFINASNDPTGTADHGTPVGGTMAAVNNNGIGGASITWNCTLMPVASLGSTDTYEGIVYAVSKGADVINCSWGRTGSFSAYEQNIIYLASNNGVLVAASAGNEAVNNDITPHYPSSYRTVLAVGATNKTNDQKASFSNYGKNSVHIYAPGVSIYVPYPGGYAWVDGTSFSSPMVAGLAGLVKTKFNYMNNEDIRDRILLTSDNIDDVNPQYAGKLGAGRINAFHAVDPDYPVLRTVLLDIDDSGGNSVVNPGEVINLGVWLKSYYTSVSDATVELSENDDFVTVTNSSALLTGLSVGDSTRISFQIETAENIPDGHEIRFTVTSTVGTYIVQDYFTVTAYGDYLTHDTGVIQTSITTQGNIGYTSFGAGQSAGAGFVYNGQDYLYEAGLMVGTGLGTISDCIRGVNPNIEDNDFRTANGEILSIYSPGSRTYEQGLVTLVDSAALSPIGLSIRQESFADTVTGFNNFVIFKYTISSFRSASISNLHVGLFVDWNINSGNKDFADFDSVNVMGVVKNLPTGGNRIVATKLLTGNSGVSYRTIDNAIELADGFNILEKWNFMTGGIQTRALLGKDVSVLVTEGPFQLDPDSSITVGFALIAAQSDAELQTSAQNAQIFWDNVLSGIPGQTQISGPSGFRLAQNYPNPFNPSTTIEFTVPERSDVELLIYNTMGQKVKTLVLGPRNPGDYRIQWDGRNERGLAVSSGVYIYRLRVGKVTDSRKMIFMR